MFSALHYASYRGNVEIMKVLLDLGADMNIQNSFGLNVLHIAAQGDSPVSIYLFHKIHKMSLSSTDSRGSTPLHWACFSNSELALIYLVSWMSLDQFDIQDNEGFTALHIAVKTCEKQKNARPVKALLYRGASQNVKDKEGKKPIDEVQKLNSISLRAELEGYLQHRGGFCEALMIKPPLKKTEKSCKMPTLFLLFNMIVYACLLVLVFPSK